MKASLDICSINAHHPVTATLQLASAEFLSILGKIFEYWVACSFWKETWLQWVRAPSCVLGWASTKTTFVKLYVKRVCWMACNCDREKVLFLPKYTHRQEMKLALPQQLWRGRTALNSTGEKQRKTCLGWWVCEKTKKHVKRWSQQMDAAGLFHNTFFELYLVS